MFHRNPEIIHATDFHRIEAMTIERRTVSAAVATEPTEPTEGEEATTEEATTTEITVLHLTVELKDDREYSDTPQRLFINAMPPLILPVEPVAGNTEPLPDGEQGSTEASTGDTGTPPVSTGNGGGKANGGAKRGASAAVSGGFGAPTPPVTIGTEATPPPPDAANSGNAPANG